jgi:hypothetical protein
MVKINGFINRINETINYTNFDKRTFWLELRDKEYTDIIQLELWKNDCTMIDSYKVGDEITAYVDIKGKIWKKDDKEVVANTLKCWNIEKEGISFKKL